MSKLSTDVNNISKMSNTVNRCQKHVNPIISMPEKSKLCQNCQKHVKMLKIIKKTCRKQVKYDRKTYRLGGKETTNIL